MRRRPIMRGDRPDPYRVVLVTMDSHTAGPAARVQDRLAQDFPGLTVSVHAAAEWAENPGALQAAKAAVASGDLVIANMLFLEEHISAILPDLRARRDGCDAMIGCISASEVVALTRLGGLDMSQPTSRAMGLIKRLRGARTPGAASGKSQMTMLRRLPRILRFLPGKAQDLRAWFLTMQVLARRLGRQRRVDGALSRLALRPPQRLARRTGGGAGGISRGRPLPPAAPGADRHGGGRSSRASRAAGDGRPPHHARLCALRRHRALRRRDRGTGGARPAGDPGLRVGARTRVRRSRRIFTARPERGSTRWSR